MVCRIQLTQGFVALVDDEDFESLNGFKWHFERARVVHGEGGGYAVRTAGVHEHGRARNEVVRMHREILGLAVTDKTLADHIDGNGLNNQRSNLRRCASQSLNFANRTRLLPDTSSRFRGVSWNANSQRWQVQISVNSVKRYLGLFESEEAAAMAYDRAAVEGWGEFARPNFPVCCEGGSE